MDSTLSTEVILEIIYKLHTLKDLKNFCKTDKNIRNICMNNKTTIIKNFIKKLFGTYNDVYLELFILLNKLKDPIILNSSSINIDNLNWNKILHSKYNKSDEFFNYFKNYTKEYIRQRDINTKIKNIISQYQSNGLVLTKAGIENIRRNVRTNPDIYDISGHIINVEYGN